MKNRKIRRLLITSVVLTMFIIILSFVMLQLFFSFVVFNIERGIAYDQYDVLSHSYLGTSQTWKEIETELKANFANSGWAMQMASGNIATSTSLLFLVAILLAGFIASVNLYNVRQKIKSLKKKRNKQTPVTRNNARAQTSHRSIA